VFKPNKLSLLLFSSWPLTYPQQKKKMSQNKKYFLFLLFLYHLSSCFVSRCAKKIKILANSPCYVSTREKVCGKLRFFIKIQKLIFY